jgi:hypothetical protein
MIVGVASRRWFLRWQDRHDPCPLLIAQTEITCRQDLDGGSIQCGLAACPSRCLAAFGSGLSSHTRLPTPSARMARPAPAAGDGPRERSKGSARRLLLPPFSTLSRIRAGAVICLRLATLGYQASVKGADACRTRAPRSGPRRIAHRRNVSDRRPKHHRRNSRRQSKRCKSRSARSGKDRRILFSAAVST